MLYIESPSTDPAFNLALEQYVFDCLPRSERYFMLWRNENAVIVGKNQNTIEQIDPAFTEARGISVVRRLSGGGAVYHDLGNINFTFITDAIEGGALDLQSFCVPIVAALRQFSVDSEITGRNDITIGGRKFSGNAQYVKNGRVMHHGTIMFDSDLDTAAAALRVGSDKVMSKGVDSVRSRMTNVKPHIRDESVDIRAFWAALKSAALEWGGAQKDAEARRVGVPSPTALEYALTADDTREIERIRAERYALWEWNYGKSPAYCVEKRRRIEGCGSLEVYMDVKNGAIAAFSVFGDYFCVEDQSGLADRLTGCPLRPDALRKALTGVDIGRYFNNLSLEEFIEIIL